MQKPNELFLLRHISDNPIYEGFGIVDLDAPSLIGRCDIIEDITPGYEVSETVRKWQPVHLSDVWKPLKVEGRVAPFNDSPGVVGFPAFSKRACDVLRDLLEPNGELLPLDSEVGDYYFFNITTVADVLDVEKSKCNFWCDPPTTVVSIESYEFIRGRLSGLTIFRIYDNPNDVIVSDEFVKRVFDNGLIGFNFYKIWPLPAGANWKTYNQEYSKTTDDRAAKLRKHTFVIILPLKGQSLKADERKKIKILEDELDALLVLRSVDEPYYGSYEGSDKVGDEFRLFISCPDVDKLANKLEIWLENIRWNGEILALKRYGGMYDVDAEEILIKI